MHKRITTLVITLVYLGSPMLVAADPPVRDHDIEPDDYFKIGVAVDCVPSPDGKLIAFTESRWDEIPGKRELNLWVVDPQTKALNRLTSDWASDGSPMWSPDGRYIYFTSARQRGDEKDPPYNGKTQVWRVSPAGGVPEPVTRVKEGLTQFDLSEDGKTLYYTTSKEVVDEEWKDLKKQYGDLEYGHGVTNFSQVWKMDLTLWQTQKLIDEKRVIIDFDVSPDERRIAMLTTPDETLLTREGWSRLDVYDAQTKKVAIVTEDGWRGDHPSPFGWLGGLSWSADNKALAFSIDFDGYPGELFVVEWKGDDVAYRWLERPDQVTVSGASMQWRGQTRDLCFMGEQRARQRVYCITNIRNGSQGAFKTLTPGDVVVFGFGYPRAGDPLAIVMTTTTHPRDVFLVSDSGKYDRLTKMNPQVDTWKLPQISLVTWKGANGDEVEGILELPPDYKPGDGPLPMVVELHGGPTDATKYRLRLWIYGRTLFPAKGYALLSPNYRGSTGYGDKFMTDLIGRENDIEVEDILTGVEAMIERGIADPDRIGVMGWSNGGFLTNAVITKSKRFKAASSGAGVLDMVIQWGTEDTPGHVVNYMKGALPWDDPEHYRKSSPIYDLDKVTTPTIIHVGGSDARVPAAHSRAMYRAMRHYLHVPVELVVYPGEGHGLRKYENRKAKMEWDLAWFDKYLLGKNGNEEDPKE